MFKNLLYVLYMHSSQEYHSITQNIHSLVQVHNRFLNMQCHNISTMTAGTKIERLHNASIDMLTYAITELAQYSIATHVTDSEKTNIQMIAEIIHINSLSIVLYAHCVTPHSVYRYHFTVASYR